jgi:Domain of unknown function (DUF1707)
MGELGSRIRAGDADRQRVAEKLGKHFGEGRLTVAEFDERLARAHAVVYLDELPPLTADLPPDPVPIHRPAGPPAWVPHAAVAVLMAMVLAWSVVAVVHGAPPLFALLLLFLFLRHRRWSGRW